MTVSPEPDAYLLGTALPELQRLQLQDDLWLETTESLWDRAGFETGHALLELGCGPGFSALRLARRVGPSGQVVGRDRSPGFLGHLCEQASTQGLPWIETLQGDIDAECPAGHQERFDGLFARWLLCWMDRPQDALRLAKDCLRPGGRLALLDYFHYRSLDLLPHDPAFRRGISAVEAAWTAAGGNPDLGTRLPALVEAEGLEIVSAELVTRYATPRDPLWRWPTSFFPQFMGQLAQEGFLEPHEADAFLGAFRRSEADPDGLFLAPPMLALVARKPAA